MVSDSLRPHGLYRNSPGQNTGVGSLSLLQGIFPTQGSNPGLPHCRQILYQLSHKGSPLLLAPPKWLACPHWVGSGRTLTFGGLALSNEKGPSGVPWGEQLPLSILPPDLSEVPPVGKGQRESDTPGSTPN